ncbi:MAG: hypothetical protein KGH58_02650 [Candidatus Micrarchaeota archaeon]|nr:hypothetical protein [Candidatus Micrarchaeota archaeon]
MRRIILLLLISTLAYAFLNIFTYTAIQHLSLNGYLLGLGIGALVSALVIIRSGGMSFSRKGMRGLALELSGGAALALSSIGVYALYRSSSLAGGMPLLGASVIVFLAIDFLFFSKEMRRKEAVYLVAGVLAVAVGIFVAQSHGFVFNYSILPILLFIMVSQGAGYYLFLYGARRESSGTRLLAFPVFIIITGIGSAALYSGPLLGGISALPLASVIIGGMLLSLAVGFEVVAALPVKGAGRWGDIVGRNLANGFTYMDILVVLAWSVLLSSYTPQEILGGLIILGGVLALNKISAK